MSLRTSIDRIVSRFTTQLLAIVQEANLAEIHAILAEPPPKPIVLPPRLLARTVAPQPKAPAPQPKAAAPKPKPVAPKPKAAAPRAKVAAKPSPAPAPSATPKPIAAPKPVVAPTPVGPRPEPLLTKALLGALRPARPMGLDDLFDVAGIDADEADAARTIVDGLVAADVLGRSDFAGAALLFVKPKVRAKKAAAPKRESLLAAPAPEPSWRPTVIVRKKTGEEKVIVPKGAEPSEPTAGA